MPANAHSYRNKTPIQELFWTYGRSADGNVRCDMKGAMVETLKDYPQYNNTKPGARAPRRGSEEKGTQEMKER